MRKIPGGALLPRIGLRRLARKEKNDCPNFRSENDPQLTRSQFNSEAKVLVQRTALGRARSPSCSGVQEVGSASGSVRSRFPRWVERWQCLSGAIGRTAQKGWLGLTQLRAQVPVMSLRLCFPLQVRLGSRAELSLTPMFNMIAAMIFNYRISEK